MKKIFEIIGFLSLMLFTFTYTSKISMVIKENDDVMDAMRYAIYNKHKNTEAEFLNSPYI